MPERGYTPEGVGRGIPDTEGQESKKETYKEAAEKIDTEAYDRHTVLQNEAQVIEEAMPDNYKEYSQMEDEDLLKIQEKLMKSGLRPESLELKFIQFIRTCRAKQIQINQDRDSAIEELKRGLLDKTHDRVAVI